MSSHYEIVASTFSVIDISEPINLTVHPNEELISVLEKFMELNPEKDWCCLVREGNQIYGYFTFDDDCFATPIKGIAREKASPILPHIIVPSSLSIMDLLPLFEQHYFYFVLNLNNITHIVNFQDLDKLPMKLCLFCLFMELESQMLRILLSKYSSIENYLSLLSNERLTKAEILCKAKYGFLTPHKLMLCTTFVDKKEIIQKDPVLRSKLPFKSRRQGDKFF